MEAGRGSEAQGQPWLHSELGQSGYMRSYLRKQKKYNRVRSQTKGDKVWLKVIPIYYCELLSALNCILKNS